MNAEVFAFIAVIMFALDSVIFRYVMKRGADEWASMIWLHWASLLVLIPFYGIPDLGSYYLSDILILLVSSALWMVADLNNTKAYRYLDASVMELLSSLRFILIAMAGVIIFGESINRYGLIGMLLIIGATLSQLEFKNIEMNKGIALKLLAVCFAAGAMVTDKHLAERLSEGFILIYGFLVPAVFYTALGYRSIPKVIPSLKSSNFVLMLAPIACAGYYAFLIKAFATGELFTTFTIQQTAIIFIFLLEFWLLGVRSRATARFGACAVCAVGCTMVCVLS